MPAVTDANLHAGAAMIDHRDSRSSPHQQRGAFAIGRRALLGSLGAGICLPGRSLAAPSGKPERIDLHHHFGCPAYERFRSGYPEAGLPPSPPDSIARSLADMETGGTRLAVLSSFVPATGGTQADRQALARSINEYGAGAVRDHPGRFALFAVLPLPNVEGCLTELAYGLDTLGAVGVAVYSEAAGKYLGDPQFSGLMAELDRRHATLFVHPHTDVCCRNPLSEVPDAIIEYGTSTTRTIASLIFSGTEARYPNIRFVFSHGGGAMPFLIERFLGRASAEIVPGIMTSGQDPIQLKQPAGTALAALRRFHYDTAQIANPVALRALATVVGSSQIVYGTDFWYRRAAESARGLMTSGVFTAPELSSIEAGNAMRLMPKLKTLMADLPMH